MARGCESKRTERGKRRRVASRDRDRGTRTNPKAVARLHLMPVLRSAIQRRASILLWCVGALALFQKPTWSPPIPQRYCVITLSYDRVPRRTVKRPPKSCRRAVKRSPLSVLIVYVRTACRSSPPRDDVGAFRSFRVFELPTKANTGNCSVDRPCFLSDHIRPPLGPAGFNSPNTTQPLGP